MHIKHIHIKQSHYTAYILILAEYRIVKYLQNLQMQMH